LNNIVTGWPRTPNPEIILSINQLPFVGRIFETQLQQRGHPVITANTSQQAFTIIEKEKVDLVILEVGMPHIDGFEVLDWIRKRFNQNELPVIMVTASKAGREIVKSLECGANDFITKPIDLNIAFARIRIQLEIRRMMKALQESRERYSMALEGTSDGIWDWDLVADKIFFSSRWKAMLGYKEHEIDDHIEAWFERVHPDDRQRVQRKINDYLLGMESHFSAEYRILHRDRSYRWCLARGIARFDASGKPYRIAGSQTDVTYRGIHDDLTGLPKREIFLERLAEAVSRQRNPDRPYLAVHEFQFERFQKINTTFGDKAGDSVLLSFVEKVQPCLSQKDALARLEGANFVVLQDDIASSAEAQELANNILKRCNVPQIIEGQELVIRVYGGTAIAHPPQHLPEEILKDAHAALLHALKGDLPRHTLFEKAMRHDILRNLELEIDLRSAIKRQQLFLLYQPQVDLNSMKIVGAEALLRWQHPNEGLVSPARFIPLAESSGDIVEIGFWVLEHACRQCLVWIQEGFEDMRIGVNLSGQQLKYPGLVEQITKILEDVGLPATNLDLELTESILMDDLGPTGRVVEQLHDLGAHIHIDDFGTGYSSLSYLSRFPIDALKIDRAFVKDINSDDDRLAITSAIISMGRSLGMLTIAEGVEEKDELNRLQQLECDQIQGFYFGKPMPGELFLERLDAQRKGSKSSPGKGK